MNSHIMGHTLFPCQSRTTPKSSVGRQHLMIHEWIFHPTWLSWNLQLILLDINLPSHLALNSTGWIDWSLNPGEGKRFSEHMQTVVK